MSPKPEQSQSEFQSQTQAPTQAQLSSTLVLGTNEIVNCDVAVILGGVEVFRLRDRADDQLVADFEMRTPDGVLVAKVAKNNVVFPTSGSSYNVENSATYSRLIDAAGIVLAMAEG